MQEARFSTGFWDSLNDRQQAALSARGRESVFGRGEALCIEGDSSTHVYVLLVGWAKVVSATLEGHEIVLALRGPGDVVGELASELDGYRTATVRALVRVRALSVVAERFMAFLDAYPPAARAYRHVIAQRVRETGDNLRDRMESTGAQRLARLMLELGERCGEGTERGVTLTVPLSQTDLASWVGVSRATVTRALREWRERNLVSTRLGHTTIIDSAALRRISGTAGHHMLTRGNTGTRQAAGFDQQREGYSA